MAIVWGSTWWAVAPCHGQVSSELGLPTIDSSDLRPGMAVCLWLVEKAFVTGVNTGVCNEEQHHPRADMLGSVLPVVLPPTLQSAVDSGA